jgi:hypothetical protein
MRRGMDLSHVRYSIAHALCLVTLMAGGARAQTTFPSAPDDPQFQRSTLPSECVMASKRLAVGQAWVANADTAFLDATNTLSPSAVAALRACKAHVDPHLVPDAPLPMYELSLQLGDVDSAWYYLARARAALPSWISPTHHMLLDKQLLYNALRTLLGTPSSRPETIEHLVRTLDSLPKDTTTFQSSAYLLWFRKAAERMDTARMARAYDGFAANVRAWLSYLPSGYDRDRIVRMQSAVADAVGTLAEVDARDRGMAAALAEAERRATAAVGTDARAILDDNLVLGTHPPPVADSGATLAADGHIAWAPLPMGRVTLVAFVPRCRNSDYGFCAKEYALIRRLYNHYGDSAALVLVAGTTGELNGTLIAGPAAERAALTDYFLRTIRLPGQLVVSHNTFTRKPDPDRRIVWMPNPIGKTYGKPREDLPVAQIVVLDRSGTVVARRMLDPTNERQLRYVVDGLLRDGGRAR